MQVWLKNFPPSKVPNGIVKKLRIYSKNIIEHTVQSIKFGKRIFPNHKGCYDNKLSWAKLKDCFYKQ